MVLRSLLATTSGWPMAYWIPPTTHCALAPSTDPGPHCGGIWV